MRKKVSHRLGLVIGRGKKPPADIVAQARQHMATLNGSKLPASRILKLVDFAEQVYLPWIKQSQRPSTHKGYSALWTQHLKPHCEKTDGKDTWLKDVRTFHCQGWLNAIAKDGAVPLSRNSLKRIQSVLSGLFTVAKNLGYYDGVNPVSGTRVDPGAPKPASTYAYTLEEIKALLDLLPEPAATAFAVAAFAGLRVGELEGLQWPDYRDGELHVERSIWNGLVGAPKTAQSAAAVPIIRQLAARLEAHRRVSGDPQTGPMFRNSLGKPLSMSNILTRAILPVLRRCGICGRSKGMLHVKEEHLWQRDPRLPAWHGWHACRRGLGSNLHRLGVPPKVIQRILRHSNVSTTNNYYILPTGADALAAMKILELEVPENQPGQLRDSKSGPGSPAETIN